MDYITKPTSRKGLRKIAIVMRRIFGVNNTGAFPVLDCLERLSDIFDNTNYVIVEDRCLPSNVMAQCCENDRGGWTIQIKQSIYDGAYRWKIGAYLGFICHEICHVFLFAIGYKPIATRGFDNVVIEAFRSVEWQAKALCGEVMIPYEESNGMSVNEIITQYHVSKGFAEMRQKF